MLLICICIVLVPVCDETKNLTETGSGTFFRYQIFSETVPGLFSVPNSLRDRFRDFFRYQIFFETDSETFFGTKFFRDRFRDFFRYQFFFETGSDTIQKIQKSRERDETDTETQTDTKILTRNCEVNMRKGYKRFEKVKWESLETGKFRDRDQICL